MRCSVSGSRGGKVEGKSRPTARQEKGKINVEHIAKTKNKARG